MMPTPVTLDALEELIANDEISEEEILEYVEYDSENSRAFEPAFRAKPGTIIEEDIAAEGEIFMRIFNRASRKRRERRYRKKLPGWNGLKIVSEGDSWFQFPVLLEDVIDQIFDKYAILSLGAAGDWIENIIVEQEYLRAIEEENPDVFLISGGGNDLVGDGRLAEMLHSFDPNRQPADYPNQNFDDLLDRIEGIYTQMFDNLTARFVQISIVCHGYDHAIPANGKWLGKPMRRRGIVDPVLQKDIMRIVMDRFNTMLQNVATQFAGVHYVNARGSVGSNQWFDELHPTNEGFINVARKFVSVINGV